MAVVGLFARPPRVGKVKTRLIPALGAETATRVYRYCLEHALDVTRAAAIDYRIFLSETGDDPAFSGEVCLLQHGEDLGERMFNALRELLTAQPDGAMIIGSDCLDLEARHLHEATSALLDHELVLLPAIDGGYALIGCLRIDARLFHGVRWSTEHTCDDTLVNARKLGWRVRLLDMVRDIDRPEDLTHYPGLVALTTQN